MVSDSKPSPKEEYNFGSGRGRGAPPSRLTPPPCAARRSCRVALARGSRTGERRRRKGDGRADAPAGVMEEAAGIVRGPERVTRGVAAARRGGAGETDDLYPAMLISRLLYDFPGQVGLLCQRRHACAPAPATYSHRRALRNARIKKSSLALLIFTYVITGLIRY